MSESGTPGALEAVDPRVTIDALRARGADHLDPVRFRFIEALARRSAAEQGDARRVLDGRLATALDEYTARFDQTQTRAGDTLACTVAQFPDAADRLDAIYRAGNFRELRQFIASLQDRYRAHPLAELLSHIQQHSPQNVPVNGAGEALKPREELTALAYFRNTWSRLKVDQQLARALAQAPENAGPLNSHLLVLQSLKLMRDISPEYLRRFMAYADALLWLDQADSSNKTVQKNIVRSERDKKRKTGRSNPG
ncbi:DUF2894 domain-containing protein [Zoogloea sp.]|uniref:DUF2894 domain-containing protein n=1 Tax=Zoogloea sp. TaxID=49181 RepID=UPI002628E493|nr:DUF2894 domain-containing protein [Zoogloea sp.]